MTVGVLGPAIDPAIAAEIAARLAALAAKRGIALDLDPERCHASHIWASIIRAIPPEDDATYRAVLRALNRALGTREGYWQGLWGNPPQPVRWVR